MIDRRLLNTFKRLRRRMLLIGGTSGLGWGLVAAVVVLLAGVWVDLVLELSPALRLAVLAAAGGAMIVMVAALFLQTVGRAVPRLLARRLDEVAGTRGQILSAIDLAEPDLAFAFSRSPGLSAGLARMAVARGSELAAGVPGSRAVPAKPLGRSFGALALVAALTGLLVLLMPSLARTEWQRFTQPFADHPPYSRIKLNVEPKGAEVVYGSGLEIRVTTDGPPVDGVELVLLEESSFSRSPEGSAPTEGRRLNERGRRLNEIAMFREPDGRWRTTIADIRRPLKYFVRAGSARSRRYAVEVITVPFIEEVRFRVTPPAYTGLPEYEGELPPGGLSGLPGTRVQVKARSNRPLGGGRIDYQAGRRRKPTGTDPEADASGSPGEADASGSPGEADASGSPLSPLRSPQLMKPVAGEPREVTGTFTITAGGRIDVSVTDTDGQESTDVFTAPVTLLVDERPFVRLLQPRAVSFSTPTAVIPVVVVAEDDYGISRLQLFRSLNDSRALPMDLPVGEQRQTRVYATTQLPLAAYGLSAGDEIKLFARVEDNDFGEESRPVSGESRPVSGRSGATRPGSEATRPGSEATRPGSDATRPGSEARRPGSLVGKGAESSIAVIRIISQEDYERLQRARDGMQLLMSKYRQARRRMENLAEEVETLRKKADADRGDTSRLSQEMRDRLGQLRDRLQNEQQALQKLQQAELPYELDKQLSKYLQKQADSLQRLIKQTEQLQKNERLSSRELQEQLQEMLDALSAEQEQLDTEVILPLEQLAAALPLAQDESRFVRLYRRQRELADRLASLKGRDGEDDPALKTRMRDLQDEQRQIRDDLVQLLEEIEMHVLRLPDEERFDQLRKTAVEFVEAVRSSGASEAMVEAETGLSEFSGTRGHAGAKKAADILEQFLSKCRRMGANGAAGACLRFQPGDSPGLGQSLQATLQQLLRDSGMAPGTGFGAGAGAGGGYSTRRSTLENVGLYGGLPQLEEMMPNSSDGSSADARAGTLREGMRRERSVGEQAAFEATGSAQASGADSAVVPLKYRRKVGRYFQRIADEIGGQ